MKQSENPIVIIVREKFIEEYPSVSNGEFKEYIKCFVSWVVEETLKEVENERREKRI